MDFGIVESKIENNLKKYNLIDNNQILILGYSGGEDSTFLLHILVKLSKKYGFKIVAVHLNHNWRGEEAFFEQQKCKNIANSLGIDFYTETLPKNQKCTEITAREARYSFFERCAKKFNSKSIITAHSKTDNVETILYRIIKGTGLVGLKGIPEIRNCGPFNVYRPMLNISRKEVIEYNKFNNFEKNFDTSNNDTKYARNKLRKTIIPELAKINVNMEKSVSDLVYIVNQEIGIIDEYLSKIKREITENQKIKTNLFFEQSTLVQKRLIYNIVTSFKTIYDKQDVDELYEFIFANKGSKEEKFVSVTTNCWLSVNENYIYVLTKTDLEFTQKSIDIANEGEYCIGKTKIIVENADKNEQELYSCGLTIYADLTKTGFPLCFRIRNTDSSDFICPLGMNGHRMKLKKFLSSKKLSILERKSILLLCKENEVLWVPKYGISEKIKVNRKATHKITIMEKEEK